VTMMQDDRGSERTEGPEVDSEERLWLRDIQPLHAQGMSAEEISRKILLDEALIGYIIERWSKLSASSECPESRTVGGILPEGEESPRDILQVTFNWLKDPNLLENLVHDLGRCGIVGEPGNVVAVLLFYNSRLWAQPLTRSPSGQTGASHDGGKIEQSRRGITRRTPGVAPDGLAAPTDGLAAPTDGLDLLHGDNEPRVAPRKQRETDGAAAPEAVRFGLIHEIGRRCSQVAEIVERWLRRGDIDQ